MMNTYREPARDIPVYASYDVVVVGGGCAGFAAAVAAARNGAKTIVLERFPYFGGTATASLMANIVGTRNQVEPNNLQVCKGIGEELILSMLSQGGASVTKNAYKSRERSNTKGDLSYSYAFDTEIFKKATLEMVREAGCDILFHVYFSDVILEDGAVKGVIIESKSGRLAILGKVIIDATGDGDVAARAGVPFWQTKHDESSRLNDALMYKVSGFDENISIESCVFGNSMILWGPNPGPHNGVDVKELTDMEIKVRTEVFQHLENLKQTHPDLKNARVSDTGSLLGIRQTRFIEGEYQITGEDVLGGARFDDVIALASNPVIHYYGYRRFLTHEGYDIPYRCMVPKMVDGLLVAGRCMSSDQIAFESWRAMAHVLCIGEGAGVAAALSAKQGVMPRQVNIKAVQEQLIAQGAEIGQGRTI
jgi:hypothetical protein